MKFQSSSELKNIFAPPRWVLRRRLQCSRWGDAGFWLQIEKIFVSTQLKISKNKNEGVRFKTLKCAYFDFGVTRELSPVVTFVAKT